MENMLKYLSSKFDEKKIAEIAEDIAERALDGGNLSNELSRNSGAKWV
jgi:hypothetical protein